MFSLICSRINGWVNNDEVGDLRRYGAHYDVTVINILSIPCEIALKGMPQDHTGPGNGLVPSGNKPLHDPNVDPDFVTIWRH